MTAQFNLATASTTENRHIITVFKISVIRPILARAMCKCIQIIIERTLQSTKRGFSGIGQQRNAWFNTVSSTDSVLRTSIAGGGRLFAYYFNIYANFFTRF